MNIDIPGTDENRKPTHSAIDWMYPEIHDRSKQSTIEIGMCHVRANDGIRIKYDGERDGWVIEQGSTWQWDEGDKEMDQDWQEVAFIQSWAREKRKEDDQS